MISLADAIHEDAVLVHPAADDKWSLIRVMCGSLVEAGQVPAGSADRVLEAVLVREESMSTGMEMGIALPHASVPSLDSLAVALAVLPDGMDFPAMDGMPTRIVILLAIPHNDRILHVRTMAHASRLLHDESTRNALLCSTRPAQVLSALHEAEARLKQVT